MGRRGVGYDIRRRDRQRVSAPDALRRGAIVTVALDPAVGSEAAKTRPGVIVSNNHANEVASRVAASTVTIVPLTSNTKRVFPFQVLLPAATSGLSRDSKAQVEQVRTVSTTRLHRVVGWVPPDVMAEVDDALRLHLAL